MNANELADVLENITTYKEAEHDIFSDKEKLTEAATMLRQQQVRIEQLLETQDYLYKRHDEQQAEIEALKLRVGAVKLTNSQLVDLVQLHREEAEKMRNEILAWENAEVPAEVMAETIVELEKRGFITHPAKTLTDEEIEDLIDSEIPMILLGGRLFYRQFARAILRKAQEK